MDSEPMLQHPLELPAELYSIITEASLPAALDRTVRLVAGAANAGAAALFPFDGNEIEGEYWSPAQERVPEAVRAAFRRAAKAALSGREAAAVDPSVNAAVPALELRLAAAGGAPRAAICFSPFRTGDAGGDEAQIAAALQLAALRLAAHQEAARSRALQGWLKTLDEQLRVLDRERQKFAAMVHRSDARVFVTDLSLTIGWTNSAMGSPPRLEAGSTWIGLSCRDVCSSFAGEREPADCGECPVAHALETNRVVHREFRQSDPYVTRDLYLSALPIKGPDGRPHEAMVMIQDLSDLEVLRRSESRYRLLFERSGKAIVVVEPDTHQILLANPMASRMTRYSSDELNHLTLESLYPEAEWAILDGEYRKAFVSGTLSTHECRVRTRDGEERQAVVSGTRYDFEGLEAMMLEFQDITETKRVAEALQEAEHRLRTVVANAPIVVFALDRNGRFTLSEGKGLEVLGVEAGEVVGRSVHDLYGDVPEPDDVRRALAGEEVNAVVRVGGLAFETRSTPLKDGNGEVMGVIGVATDVTDRHRLEEQLRHAHRMEAIGRLAGGVAHDFNNMLAAMLGHSEMMMARLEPGHPLRRNAEEIRKAAERGAMLTRQLLAFSRKEVLAPAVLDVNAVLGGMDSMLRRLIGEDIDLATIPAPIPAVVKMDCGQLQQVIMNLVVNARDAMPQGGRLTIEVACVALDQHYAQKHADVTPGPHVMLTVSDSGCGMDAETLSHIFEPFFTTKTRGKGTGLGLATVYGIIKQCGGHLRVSSEPGTGTTFKIHLPRVEQPEPSGSPGATHPARGGAETVLLVEDEESVRSMVRDLLLDHGYQVLEARHGAHALEVASAHPGPIHLLVTDVVMPQMGGGELAQKLSALRPSLRVLFISGYTDDAIVRHGVLERGSAFLQKPFSLEVFTRRVREVLDGPAGLAGPGLSSRQPGPSPIPPRAQETPAGSHPEPGPSSG